MIEPTYNFEDDDKLVVKCELLSIVAPGEEELVCDKEDEF